MSKENFFKMIKVDKVFATLKVERTNALLFLILVMSFMIWCRIDSVTGSSSVRTDSYEIEIEDSDPIRVQIVN